MKKETRLITTLSPVSPLETFQLQQVRFRFGARHDQHTQTLCGFRLSLSLSLFLFFLSLFKSIATCVRVCVCVCVCVFCHPWHILSWLSTISHLISDLFELLSLPFVFVLPRCFRKRPYIYICILLRTSLASAASSSCVDDDGRESRRGG
jgi:hypothetical protein